MFFVHFGLPNKFFSLKNRKLVLETENKGKKQLPNIPLGFGGILVIGFKGILVMFNVIGVFRSFCRFMGYFGNFKVSGVYMSFFRFKRYFGNFGGFIGALVFLFFIFWVYTFYSWQFYFIFYLKKKLY